MAENTVTYKAVIDVETEGAKNIDLLNKTISTSIGEFDNLNEAISKTQDTLGKIDPKSKEFKELSKELSNLKDDLADTEIASVRFTEALGASACWKRPDEPMNALGPSTAESEPNAFTELGRASIASVKLNG